LKRSSITIVSGTRAASHARTRTRVDCAPNRA
jgi:hypothetical protein